MREFFSDKNFIEAKILVLAKFLLIVSIIIFFLPLIVLPFFNHPFADDYFCGYNLNNKSFIDYQVFIYKNWGGRFAATFAGSLFAYHNFLYNHYYAHTLLLLALNFGSAFFLINTFNKYILKANFTFSKILLLTLIFLALEICCLPQYSTFLFWFSSAITYQLPVVLVQTEIALFILLFNSNNKLLRSICAVVLPVLVFVTIGFNELFIVVQATLFVIVFYFKLHKQYSAVFIFMMLAFIAGSLLLILSPGSQARMSIIDPKSVSIGLVAIIYHSLETLWNIFKNPLVWFCGAALFLYAGEIKNQRQANTCIKKLSGKKWLFPSVILIFLLASVSVAVIGLKGGIIPDRYLNAVACFVLVLLLLFFFVSGVNGGSTVLSLKPSTKKIAIYFFLIAGLLFNTYITDAYKSIIIAPVYNTILNEREDVLKQAAQGNKIAVVKDYNTVLSELMKTKYSSNTTTLQQLIQQKPPLLYFEDDLETNYSVDILKKYYGLDSIIVKKN